LPCGNCPAATTKKNVYWQVAFPIDVTTSCDDANGGCAGGMQARRVLGGPLVASINYSGESRIILPTSGPTIPGGGGFYNWKLPQDATGSVCRWRTKTGLQAQFFSGDWTYNPCLVNGESVYDIWAIVERLPGNVWRAYLGTIDVYLDYWDHGPALYQAEWSDANCNVDTAIAKANERQGGFVVWTDPLGPPFWMGTNGSSHFFFRDA
jgi:hypothetical protein